MLSPYNHLDCSGGCATAPLTLADRSVITGRSLIQWDDDSRTWYCVDCLNDLPDNGYRALFHVCGPVELPPAPPVEHKTRTTEPAGYQYLPGGSGIRMTDKRGRLMYDRSSWAICSCGWVGAGYDRRDARRLAKTHREEQAGQAV